MDLLSPDLWKSQWDVVTSAPWLILPSLVVAGLIGWKVKGSLDDAEVRGLKTEISGLKAEISVREQRRLLAEEREEDVSRKLGALDAAYAKLQQQIATGATRDIVSSTSATVTSLLTDVATANDTLREIIVRPLPLPADDAFPRSVVGTVTHKSGS